MKKPKRFAGIRQGDGNIRLIYIERPSHGDWFDVYKPDEAREVIRELQRALREKEPKKTGGQIE